MSSHGEGKNVKSRSGFPGSFRTSPPDVAFAANRWPHMGNCSSDAQPSLAQRLRHLLSSAGGRLGCHRDDLSRGCPLCSDVSRRIPRGRNDFPNQGSRKEPEAEQSSSNLPEPVRTCMLHLPPLPPPTIDAAFPANRSGNVRKCSELGGPPPPSPGLWFPVKYSEMFGNVRKWWGAPSPTPPPGRWVRLKCSEMFGNVRN